MENSNNDHHRYTSADVLEVREPREAWDTGSGPRTRPPREPCEAWDTVFERQPCEVWTRVMGYHRPVSSFNQGKQAEFQERKFFHEDCLPGANPQAAPLRIYMAGPLFSLAERNHNVALAAAIERLMPEAECVLPQVRAEALRPDLQKITRDCAEQAATCEVTVACLDGPDTDSGTAMEVVHAGHYGRLVVGYRTDFRGSETDGLNAMVRHALHAFVVMPSYEATVDKLAQAIVDSIRRASRSAN